MQTVRETARELRAEAVATNERRLVVLHGRREAGYTAARIVAETIDVGAVSVSDREIAGDRIAFERTDELLGTTNDCVVVDCHDTCEPNALGRATGAVDGGGLLVFVTPPLDEWPNRRDRFDEFLASPPFSLDDVSSRFKRRLVRTLRAHRGIAIVDVDTGIRTRDGSTGYRSPAPSKRVSLPDEYAFPTRIYEACRTADQRDAVRACERLYDETSAVILEADRGRGKSSAAGLAAAAFAAEGEDVLVTAPSYRNAAELFERAAEALERLGELAADRRDGSDRPHLLTAGGGAIRFQPPLEAIEEGADVLFVDEAAALPVRTLESLLSVARGVCFSTTVRGYEGSGRGFDVRFRDTLEDARSVRSDTLSEPIRYAPADPIEVWVFHALLLGATPPPSQLVSDVTPDETTYGRLDRSALADDEALLREVFGLLVSAHYRTEPNDLARLLDAPNIAVRALTVEGHAVAVALLAREGGLGERTRQRAYEGDRIGGNLLADLLTSQLRDIDAGVPIGVRVLRIATHHAVRSRGHGSRLLAAIEDEYGADDATDYLGVSYGATPELLSFWTANGYRPVHLSSTRNGTSGEHSAVMLRPLTESGRELAARHDVWFRRRLPSVLSEPLDSVDPDIVRGVLAGIEDPPSLCLSDFEWRLVASAERGPGLYDTAPRPYRRLAFRALVDGALDDPEMERLLVVKVLQTNSWENTATRLGYASPRACKLDLGRAYGPIVDRYGGSVARAEADRYRDQ